jgi:hypothetical protein
LVLTQSRSTANTYGIGEKYSLGISLLVVLSEDLVQNPEVRRRDSKDVDAELSRYFYSSEAKYTTTQPLPAVWQQKQTQIHR